MAVVFSLSTPSSLLLLPFLFPIFLFHTIQNVSIAWWFTRAVSIIIIHLVSKFSNCVTAASSWHKNFSHRSLGAWMETFSLVFRILLSKKERKMCHVSCKQFLLRLLLFSSSTEPTSTVAINKWTGPVTECLMKIALIFLMTSYFNKKKTSLHLILCCYRNARFQYHFS